MKFQKNNQYWKLRGKDGRNRFIETPEQLLNGAEEYFTWCQENPIYTTEIVNAKQGVQLVEKPLRRPFQKEGFALFLGLSAWRVVAELKNVNDDFMQIITRIEKIIYTQKFEGATVGQFNTNIIARDLGLSENIDHKSNGEQIKQVFVIGGKEIEF
jgi:hypothetical protein